MSGFSIKSKVTLWYTALMSVLMALALTFILSISNNLVRTSVHDRLKSVVSGSFKDIEFHDGKLEIDKDLDFFNDGIFLSVYDADGDLLHGRAPHDFNGDVAFSAGGLQSIELDGKKWYVFDEKISVKRYGEVWVRGIASPSDTENAIQTVIYLSLIAFPFIILVAAVGGYLVTKKAFRPIKQINEAAERIGGGNDLTGRINLGEGKDEVYALANTFDSMFDRLEQSFESEKQFTSDASHELRTPTSVIISQCEYALENAAGLDEAKDILTVILEQSKKMSGLISQLLTLARTDKSNQKLEMELVNLSELAELVSEDLKLTADEKNITIKTEIEPDILIRADETMMMRLLINLISNGIAYGKEGGFVSVSLSRESGMVAGVVKDNGIGISKEHTDKIWDRFYQVDSARSADRDSSMGLGLSMVKWIVTAHGGTISARSTLGEGSSFLFLLPIET